jgi:hypothetical protein
MASYLPLVQGIQVVSSSHLLCHQRATQIWAALRVASLYLMLPLIMAGRSAFSYLVSKISTTHLVAPWVLIGSWAKQVFCLCALVMLGLSCRLVIFLMGRRILFVIFFSWKSNTTPRLCIVCLPIMGSYMVWCMPRWIKNS